MFEELKNVARSNMLGLQNWLQMQRLGLFDARSQRRLDVNQAAYDVPRVYDAIRSMLVDSQSTYAQVLKMQMMWTILVGLVKIVLKVADIGSVYA